MQQTTPRNLNITHKQKTSWQNFVADMSLCCHVTLYTSFTRVQSVRNPFDKKLLNFTTNWDYVSLFLGAANVVTPKLLSSTAPVPFTNCFHAIIQRPTYTFPYERKETCNPSGIRWSVVTAHCGIPVRQHWATGTCRTGSSAKCRLKLLASTVQPSRHSGLNHEHLSLRQLRFLLFILTPATGLIAFQAEMARRRQISVG